MSTRRLFLLRMDLTLLVVVESLSFHFAFTEYPRTINATVCFCRFHRSRRSAIATCFLAIGPYQYLIVFFCIQWSLVFWALSFIANEECTWNNEAVICNNCYRPRCPSEGEREISNIAQMIANSCRSLN
jgi:hypothetical protein